MSCWDIIFDRRVFGTVFSHNVAYFIVGRYSGLLPYFFPGLFAIVAFLLARGRRAPWQWFVLGGAAAQILLLLVWVPYTYNGGGGSIGNRYFMSTYGVFLFLLPPIASVAWALVPWVVGGLFSAQVTFNPFFSSFNPSEHAKQGPLRWLPVELTLVNDLPINTQPNRARVWFGESRRFQIYFLDDNAYAREDLSFWVKGRAKAEFLVKTVEPASAAGSRSGKRRRGDIGDGLAGLATASAWTWPPTPRRASACRSTRGSRTWARASGACRSAAAPGSCRVSCRWRPRTPGSWACG